MSKKLLLAALTGLVIAIAAPSQGFAQATDADGDGIVDSSDRCPNDVGPLPSEGCPDADSDGVPDSTDACLNASSRQGPDLDFNGCLEPISSLSFRYRAITGRSGIRLTRLRLDVITGVDQIRARWRCRGIGCGGRIRRRGNFLVLRVTRRRLRPGRRLKIETRNRFGGGALECFSLRVGRRRPTIRSRRALTLGLPQIRC
jgi:hypothetical protein